MKHICIIAIFALGLTMSGATLAERQPAPPEPSSESVETSVQQRARALGFVIGAPVFLRIFKESSTLEVWMLKAGRFALFQSYKVCRWSGELGPKLEEGDRQSPEGVYSIEADDLRVNARWHRAMGVNFPNAYDRSNARGGSGILIHGKCSSIGCFALTDANVEEVYELVDAALTSGQPRVIVHIFPFLMTREKLAGQANHPWIEFWRDLKIAYAAFERDRLPPHATLCGDRYSFAGRQTRGRGRVLQAKCPPLRLAAPVTVAAKPRPPTIATLTPDDAKSCNPKQLRCRMLRLAMSSSAPCPKKYARCRNAQTAAIKSVDCPLKFPRCRKRGASRITIASTSNAKKR